MSGTTEELGLRITLTGNQAAAAGLKEVAAAEDQVAAGADRASSAQSKNAAATRESGAAHNLLNGMLAQMRNAVLGAMTIGALTGLIVTQTKAVYDNTAQFERYQRTLGFATGSQAAASAEMGYARRTALALGLDVGTLTQQYGRLAAATQGGSLALSTQRDLMLGLAQAGAVTGMSNEQLANSMTALTQMVSKGVVMSEELKGQLAESLPGAMQIAARAMGKTTAELQAMLDAGTLTANEFLPKFAAELKKTFGPDAAKGAETLTGALNNLSNSVTQLQLKAGEGGFGKMMAAALNQISAALNGISQERLDRLVNTAKAVRELGWFALYTPGLIQTLATGANGTQGDQNTLAGVQSDIRERMRLLPSSAGTDAQNQQLAEARTIYRDLISLIEQRAITTETAAKRMLEAEGKLQDALKKTSEISNRAAARAAEPDGYYKNSAPMQAVANDAQALYLKYMAPATKVLEDYTAALGMLSTAQDAGVMSATRYGQATAELTRTTLIALNATALQAQNAYADRQAAQVQSGIDLQRAAAESQRAIWKAAYDQQFVDRTTQAQRMAALDQQEADLDVRQAQASLATLEQKRAAWERLEGQYLTVNERLAKGFEFDQKALELKGKIAVIEQKRLDITTELNKQLYDAARAEFDLLNKIDAESKSYTDNLKQQREDQAFQLSLLGKTELQQKVLSAQYEIQKGLQAELNRLVAQENDLRDKGLLSFDAAQRIQAARDAAIAAASAQKDWTAQVVQTQDAYAKLSSTVDGFLDAALKGFGSLKDWLKTQFFDFIKTQVLKPLIMQIVVSATGGVSGGGIGGSLLGSLGSSLLGSGGLLGGGGGLLGLGSLGGLMGLGSGAGALGLLGGGANLMFTGLMGGGLSGMLGGIGMAASSGLLPLLGALGPIAAIVGGIYAIASHFDGANGTAVRYAWGDDYHSNSRPQERNTLATPFGRLGLDGDAADATRPFVQSLIAIEQLFANRMSSEQIAATSGRIGSGTSNWIGFDGDPTKAIQQETKDMMQQRFDAIFATLNFDTLRTQLKAFTGTSEDMAKWLATVAGMMQVLDQQAANVKAVIGETINVDQLAALANSGETLDATFTRVMSVFASTNSIAAMLGKNTADAFGSVGLASLAARQNLIDLAGGMQQLSQMTTYFYEHFYSEQERGDRALQANTAAVTAAFGELGLAVPANREAFRSLVEAQDLSTESGRQLYAALMRIAQAFDLIQPAAAASNEPVYTIIRNLRDLGPAAVTAANQVASAVETVQSLSFGQVIAQGAESAMAVFQRAIAAIDASGGTLSERLAAKMRAAGQLASQYDAQYQTHLRETGGIVDALGVSLAAARDAMLDQQHALAGDMASLASLTAQYGAARAERLLQLEQWRRDQIAAANGNTAVLLAIEQSYAQQRQTILTQGLSSLTSTLQTWLNNLQLNSALTTLTPEQQLAEARRQVIDAYNSQDSSAFTGAADAYLRVARDAFASGEQYTQINAWVQMLARALIAGNAPAISNGAGGGAANSAAAAANAAGAAADASQATTAAVNETRQVLAEILAQTKNAVQSEGEATRDANVSNTNRLVDAVYDRGAVRVL